jgi:ABC-type amino acid transport substrate-binding protein
MAYPDPPFNGMGQDRGGLDVDLISAIGAALGTAVGAVAYTGEDFDGIFEELAGGAYDCVVSGTSVTPDRQRRAAFAPPYVICGQSLAVDVARFPRVRSIDDLAGLTIGVRRGDTSRPIAEQLVAQGKAAAVTVYPYGGVGKALADLSTSGCDALLALAPVLSELVRDVPDVEVVQRGLSREEVAIAVHLADHSLQARIAAAHAELEADGTLQRLRRKWLGNPYRDQSLAAH